MEQGSFVGFVQLGGNGMIGDSFANVASDIRNEIARIEQIRSRIKPLGTSSDGHKECMSATMWLLNSCARLGTEIDTYSGDEAE